MVGRGIAGDVIGDPHKRQLDLQRRRAEQTGELCLGRDLVGHQVEQAYAERPDILPDGVGLAHDRDALGLQGLAGRQMVGNS